MEPIKDTFHRLVRFGHAAKERTLPTWKLARLQAERGLQWLKIRPQARAALFSTGMGVVTILLLLFSGVTAAVAALAAWFALMRHFGQTSADRQRRITESFSKAVEQLGNDKLEVRLGGIYSLERISKESPDDYWMVMENLTAFVRERSLGNEAERLRDLEQRVSRCAYFLWLEAGRPDGRAEDFWADATKLEEFGEPATDIAAVLTVLMRRQSRERERANGWRFDLRGTVLNRANLFGAQLERANLVGAQLVGANLWDAQLEGAILFGAQLERANLFGARLVGANLRGAQLVGATLSGAHLQGADLSRTMGLLEVQLSDTHGDALTKLPEGMYRPAHWSKSGLTRTNRHPLESS
jgi:Pentapeptide repeats (8 copies)/Protein of unknown function (DUF2934)